MQHGLLDQAGTWVYNSPQLSLGYQMVEDGYDVWLTNSRGNIWSKQHKRYNFTDGQFWDFSVHEMAKYDVPANLNYIMKVTEFDQVIYVGHSQGTL